MQKQQDSVPNEGDEKRRRIPIVGIGASAGGLEALQTFFQSIPADLGAAYVVIVHLAPDRESGLPEILSRETKMPVMQVGDDDKTALRPDHVYVIAPNRKLELTDSSVGASQFDRPRGQRAAIDVFFRSLAAVHGESFAVVLSGGGSDGAVGAKAVKEAGGIVLVQEPREAAHESMPRAAIATGVADVVLPVRDLAARLAELVRSRGNVQRLLAPVGEEPSVAEDEEAALERVLELLRKRTSHDFSKYKRNTVLRRLARRMQLQYVPTVHGYLQYLEQNVEEVQALFNDLLITVTTFFRDPEAWSSLQQHVIAPLIERADPAQPIRCWVPGCATGEEAYTLSILFCEEIARRRVERELIIFASDVDERALSKGRAGVYPASIAADVSDERLQRWFNPTDDHYRVCAEVRDRVVFASHSLQRDPPFSRLHLISCRNLLIYMNRELQEQVMGIFRYACRDDGYLFLGGSETASDDYFRPLVKQFRIYEARESPKGRKPTLPDLPASSPQTAAKREIERSRPDYRAVGDEHRIALEDAAPPSMLVDERWNILHLSETAGRFVQPRGGPGTLAATDLVRPELRAELSAALRHAFEHREPSLSQFVPVQFNGTPKRVAVLVQPTAGPQRRALVLLLDAGPATSRTGPAEAPAQNERERVLLERLQEAEEHVARLRADHITTDEDLRAANEELQSLNEEYRSTTEELETSKEELQSINEELQTVNVELKNKLEEVSRAHNDLENLMAATGVGTLFLDRRLCIQQFTPQLTEIFNVKLHDRGRPIADITHALNYAELERDARAVLAHLTPIERELDGRDGRAFIMRIRPYRAAEDRIEGVVMTFVEVTALKRAERVLRESEERFRALVDASAQTVWTASAEGLAEEDSESWQAFTGQTPEQRKGSGWLQAVHPDDRSTVEERWREAVRSATPLSMEFRLYYAPKRTYRWTSVRAVPLRNAAGAVRGWVGMNIDIHERKEADESLRESDRRKDEFLGMLGHELRNPLAAIRNSVEAARAHEDGAEARPDWPLIRRCLTVVDRQSSHMTRLVNDLLDITRITRDKLQLHRLPTDAGKCIGDVADALRPQIDAAGLRLEIDMPQASLYLDADPERLTQIFDNLLRNAINATAAGGEIRITARPEGASGLVSIRDSGVGIEPEQLTGLFEPYSQGRSARHNEGLGLGLTLVKRLVELHGGTISAQSASRASGSEFRLSLPLAQDVPHAADPARAAHPPLDRFRVLVVDDETDVADSFAKVLERLGQDVEVAYKGEQAVELAKRQRPRVAFLDLSMPGMTGQEVARRLREAFPASDSLTLVALTGHGARSAAGRVGAEFDHYLLKPAELGAVAELLGSLSK